MKFEYYNSNPDASTFKSGKPKNWNRDDSAIRALTCALNKTWDEVYEDLSKISKKMHNVPNAKEIVDIYCNNNKFKYVTFGKPTQGSKRPSVEEFVKNNPTGTYIIYFANYFVCVKDGVYYDVKTHAKGSVYSYWKMY